MAGGSFCALLATLQEAAPLLPADELPTLRAFAELAAEFKPVEGPPPAAPPSASARPGLQVVLGTASAQGFGA